MKKAAIFIAEGFEEVEALTPVDVLRRANIEVTTISLTKNRQVTGSHNITILADTTFNQPDYRLFDAIILPGGMPGTENLNTHNELKNLLLQFSKANKLIGAICAAPLVLGKLGLLENKSAVCYPGFEKHLHGANLKDQTVVKDKNLITAIGVGASIQFALYLVEELIDKKAAQSVAKKMLLDY